MTLAACGSSAGSTKASAATPPPTAARENVGFYYEQVRPQPGLVRLGKVKTIVVAPQTNPKLALSMIRATGANAYRYIQTFWYPVRGETDDPEAERHPEWAFCTRGTTPAVGRTDDQGRPWNFYDLNERGVLDHFRARLEAVKDQGWDGVFLDLGYAAMTGFDDPGDVPVWDRVSTCTQDPISRGSTFADAFARAVAVVHQVGLKVMLNYGASPFDVRTPMRPDPRSAACRSRDFAHCPTLDDLWGSVDSVLDEAVAHPRDQSWTDDFEANARTEQNAKHGRVAVGMLTSGTLGEQNRRNVFFEWARVKLFPIPLAVDTGEGGCKRGDTSVCNRYHLYPDLGDATLGRPVSAAPVSSQCDRGSNVRCVWVRTYEGGMSIVNVTDHWISVDLPLGVDGCRTVRDLWRHQEVDGGGCVTHVRLTLRAWTGRPLLYAPAPG
jgi:hypothetical protein